MPTRGQMGMPHRRSDWDAVFDPRSDEQRTDDFVASYEAGKMELAGGPPTDDPSSIRRPTMFVNLTPHAVTLQSADGTRFTVPPSGTVARIASEPGALIIVEGCVGFDAGIPIHDRTVWGEPVGLPVPDPTGATTYIVSALFAGRVGDRIDVVYPGTDPADGCIRDSKGMVEAVTRLIRA